MSNAAILIALGSAALFGLSTPLAKLLVGGVHPAMLAAIFYCASGVALGLFRAAVRRNEPSIEWRDAPWLAGAILAGGVAGPILMMVGLTRAGGGVASLLLTLEGVATALIAWFVFKEHFDRRIAAGLAAIVLGAMVLAWEGRGGNAVGLAAILGACACWGLDNNLTRKIADCDPVEIAMWKGLVGGPAMLTIALAVGAQLPDVRTIGAAALVGLFGIGVSLAMFVRALRDLGAARTGAYFSTAPFVGAAGAIVLLGEPLTVRFAIAGLLMAAGVYLHLTERHAHEHLHEPTTHTHMHVHDEHHRHPHAPGDPQAEPHSHRHVHVRLRHAHRHAPDLHHRHEH
jgi:drug/metabolite transporter (DMT)-like permease